jgi:hypothetical protein
MLRYLGIPMNKNADFHRFGSLDLKAALAASEKTLCARNGAGPQPL